MLPLLLLGFGLLGGVFADLFGVAALASFDQNVIWEPVRNLLNQILANIPVLF